MYGYFYHFHRRKMALDLFFRTQNEANSIIPILDPLLDNSDLDLLDNNNLVLTDNG